MPLLGRRAGVLDRFRAPVALRLAQLALVLPILVAKTGTDGIQRRQLDGDLVAYPQLL